MTNLSLMLIVASVLVAAVLVTGFIVGGVQGFLLSLTIACLGFISGRSGK